MTRIDTLTALTLTMVLGCTGNQDTEEKQVEITAESGGEITLGQARVEIPPQALQRDTSVTLRQEPAEVLGELESAAGRALIIEPEGTELAIPATVSLPLDESDNNAEIDVYVFADGDWRSMDASAVADGDSVVFSMSVFQSFAPASRVPDIGGGGNRILGTVIWPNGDAVPGADIDIFQNDSKLTTVSTDETGAFSVVDLVAGDYVLEIDLECAARAEVTVTDESPATVEIVLCGS